ncbi:alpha/beta fold hydrolase [Panacagrimonas sp.]|uniref:alpha/beta fold hydrolase n=1 Tax=Panacagrimonas sp. TaxID=2480088 RepID=UPI003B52E968
MSEAIDTPPIKTLNANGLEFAYFEMGEGPLVILLHGFPDTAHAFREVMPRIASVGYRVIAPFLRGYAPSALAPDGDYSIRALALDLLALIEHFGQGEQARVVGHDWGSVITQYAANLRPDRFDRIVLCSVPHLRKFFLAPSWAQLKRSHYIFRFQAPLWAERRIPENDFAWMVENLFRRWSPTWDFTEAHLAPIKANFSDPARLKAALAYYRAIPGLLVNPAAQGVAFAKVTVPTRMLHGALDGAIGPEMFRGQEKRFAGGFEVFEAQQLGHYIPYEDPAWLAEMSLEHFRAGAA